MRLAAEGKSSGPLPSISGVSVYRTVLGVPASNLAFAGSVEVVPVVGSTHGHGFAPKKEGLPVS